MTDTEPGYQERTDAAESVFRGYQNRTVPTDPKVLQPSGDDHLLIQPKKMVNPVQQSPSHRGMQRELMLNNKLGVNVLGQKSELSRVFDEKKRSAKAPPSPKSELDLIIQKRREEVDECDKPKPDEPEVPEFVKIKQRLNSRSGGNDCS